MKEPFATVALNQLLSLLLAFFRQGSSACDSWGIEFWKKTNSKERKLKLKQAHNGQSKFSWRAVSKGKAGAATSAVGNAGNFWESEAGNSESSLKEKLGERHRSNWRKLSLCTQFNFFCNCCQACGFSNPRSLAASIRNLQLKKLRIVSAWMLPQMKGFLVWEAKSACKTWKSQMYNWKQKTQLVWTWASRLLQHGVRNFAIATKEQQLK